MFLDHYVHRINLTLIIQIVYGIKVLPKDDPYITTAEKVAEAAATAGIPGAFLVDSLPIRMSHSPSQSLDGDIYYVASVKYIPAWFPGAGFQRKAREWRKNVVAMNVLPFEAVKRALVSLIFSRSFSCQHRL
jgi:hypothetical protein